MEGSNGQYLATFDRSVEDWTDERLVTKAMLRDFARFSLYLVNLAEADGWEYVGHSFKVGLPMSCLVVKARVDGIPHVVFCSGRTYTGCVRVFLRKLEEGWLEWVKDRYA
jgi:hypothetical protein